MIPSCFTTIQEENYLAVSGEILSKMGWIGKKSNRREIWLYNFKRKHWSGKIKLDWSEDHVTYLKYYKK